MSMATVAAADWPLDDPRKVMVFAGKGHKTYLGCLNCAPVSKDSIFNEDGYYGSCPIGRFETDSLWCKGPLADFSSTFSDYSACGRLASDPPVIVDSEGGYHGRLSVATFGHDDAVCRRFGKWRHAGLCRVARAVCGLEPEQ